MPDGKVYELAEALHGLADGASVMVSGYRARHLPEALLRQLAAQNPTGLTIICQDDWWADGEDWESLEDEGAPTGITDFIDGRISRLICSHYSNNLSVTTDDELGDDEPGGPDWPRLEVVPAGILAERIRAGGAGLRGVFLPAGAGLIYADGYESREIDGRPQVLYPALKADFALLRAAAADTLGNLVYRGTQRNWNPIMAMAANTVVVEVDEVVAAGDLDPELIITPGIFVDRIVRRGQRASWPQ